MDYYAVVGNPVAHSKSPLIHSLFASQTGEVLEYGTLVGDADHFAAQIEDFFHEGGLGLNVTVPFKEKAWELCKVLSERAELASAVNTLYLDDQGRLCGDTTDGIGVVTDLSTNLDVKLAGKRMLVVGAGGAVRGILQNLLEAKPGELVVTNRTLSKADTLADRFKRLGPIRSASIEELADQEFELVVNGTSASLAGDSLPLPASVFGSGCVAYDLMYGAAETPFNQWAKSLGVQQCFDGLGMLVEQAAASFYIWRGVHPSTAAAIRQIRGQLAD